MKHSNLKLMFNVIDLLLYLYFFYKFDILLVNIIQFYLIKLSIQISYFLKLF